jgi:hypothetical protein
VKVRVFCHAGRVIKRTKLALKIRTQLQLLRFQDENTKLKTSFQAFIERKAKEYEGRFSQRKFKKLTALSSIS